MIPISARRAFDKDLGASPVDSGYFCGTWINTSATPQGWHSLQTSMPKGVPTVHAHSSDGATVEFSGITLYGGTGGTGLNAFTAIRSSDDFRVLLQGNLNLGLLVLATFKIPEGEGIGYFSREFFARSALSAPIMTEDLGAGETLFDPLPKPEAIDPDPLLGRWRNADFQTRGLLDIFIEKNEAGSVFAHALGTSETGPPIEWGAAEIGIHACLDEAGNPSLSALASWHFDRADTHLQLRIPGGTLAIAGFNEFHDGRMNYATREFFFQAT